MGTWNTLHEGGFSEIKTGRNIQLVQLCNDSFLNIEGSIWEMKQIGFVKNKMQHFLNCEIIIILLTKNISQLYSTKFLS